MSPQVCLCVLIRSPEGIRVVQWQTTSDRALPAALQPMREVTATPVVSPAPTGLLVAGVHLAHVCRATRVPRS